jgi:putative DNA primase/helicase
MTSLTLFSDPCLFPRGSTGLPLLTPLTEKHMPLIAIDAGTIETKEKSTSDTPTLRCASADRIVTWMEAVHGSSGGLIGFTAVQVQRNTETSTYNTIFRADPQSLKQLAKEARELSPKAQAVYVTLNTVKPSAGSNWTNEGIVSRRWMLVDIDPIRPADTSSTDGEKQNARILATNVRRWLSQDHKWPKPMLGDSGNGYHLLYPIDLPNNEESTQAIRAALHAIADRWDLADVHIDKKVYDARRVVKLYGTLSKKGTHTTERPHRASALLETPPREGVVTLAMLTAMSGGDIPELAPKPTTNGTHKPTTNGNGLHAKATDPEETYIGNALANELAKLASAQPGDRNNQLFKSAAALFELINAGKLDGNEVAEAMANEAKRLGLSEVEIQTTIGSARRKTTGKARDLSHIGKRSQRQHTDPVVVDLETGVIENLDDPHRLARAFLREHYMCDQGPTLRQWDGEWWVWNDAKWSTLADKELMCELAAFIKFEYDQAASADPNSKPAKPVSSRGVANVILALGGILMLPMRLVPEQPAWVGCDGPPPRQCISCRNGIIHLPTLMAGGPVADGAHCLPTPKFYSPNVLGYSFLSDAPRPAAWEQFLASVWPEDPDSIQALQQWFGYLLTADTSQQKILLLIGPKRSGKGTITRTLRALVGEDNVAAPTLSALANPFGLQQLLGKTVAVVPESRLSGRADSQAIVERLLSISGEDPQSVERKHLTPWHGTLRTRFVLLGNELPRLGDYSGALPGRMIVLRMTRSFFDKEDLTLGERILAELPSILIWALLGWENLQSSKRFTQPTSGLEILEDFESLSNPYGAFLAERCDLDPNHRVSCQELYHAWKTWCETQGREHAGDIQGFGRAMRSAEPSVDLIRPRMDGHQVRMYAGIKLKTGIAF